MKWAQKEHLFYIIIILEHKKNYIIYRNRCTQCTQCTQYEQKKRIKTMKAKLMAPIASIHGVIAKGYYARVIYGKQVIQRCPIRKKKPTNKQIAARKWFAENMAGRKWRDVASGNRMVCDETGGEQSLMFNV